MRIVAYYRTDCPICFELKPLLRHLCLNYNIDLTEVYIETDIHSKRRSFIDCDLMDKYWFIIRRAFGGEIHVPIVLFGEERWYVPMRTTGGNGGKFRREEILEAVRRLIDEIKRDIRRRVRDKAYPPCYHTMWLTKARYG